MAFPLHFLVCNALVSLLLGLILAAKRLFKKHMTVSAQYHLWHIFVFSLLLPFWPCRIVAPGRFLLRIQQWFTSNAGSSAAVLAENTAGHPAAPFPGLTDFSTAVASSDAPFTSVLWAVWLAGIVSAALLSLFAILNVYFMRKNACAVTGRTDPELYRLFSECRRTLHIRRPVRLYASCRLSGPVSYGWIRPTVVIPRDLDILLSGEDLRCIFLHELQHCKHRDALLNDLVCLLRILYWFNPWIRYGFRRLQKDREIACDHAVISVIGPEKRLQYGSTILKYAGHVQKGSFSSPLSAMGDSKAAIRQRIAEIADYKSDSLFQKLKSMGVIFLAVLLVYGSTPLLTAHVFRNTSFHWDGKNWESLDAASYFDGTEGSFVLYDVSGGQYHIYNKDASERRVSPDSTFKIYSGLFALEEHLISPGNSLQRWDGTDQYFDSWKRDQTLATAMRDSVNWYFQNLDGRLGLAALYGYYDKISYGNCDLSGGAARYWAESSLKISPLEQVMLLSDLLENKWSFEEQNIRAVKDAMFISDTPVGKLYGKTGTGSVDGQDVNGWFVGFIENGENVYCFAANLQGSENCSGSRASKIALEILNGI
ncbi:MAG TPA: BlaR1 family beta-lactam sensor/signal transducer [Lachnospiraceae bacterium]|nr:BlaR1 family beta-lactam sensor/signal transducer [Lachnospiraceae bacterium]